MFTKQEYKNISLNQLFSDNFEIPFQKNKLHEICSYIAMYPAKLVHKLINKYTSEGNTVYDPFSGRGTPLLEARLLKRKAYASDLNPLSFVLTKAKSHTLEKIKSLKQFINMSKCIVPIKQRLIKKILTIWKHIFQKMFINKFVF